MQITFLGHSSLLIKTSSKTLLVDPFISGNPKAEGKVNIADLHPDYILVTHAHQDHTLDVEEIGKKSGSTIISNYEIATHYENKGLKAHPMNHGGSWNFDFGSLKYVNAIHSSSFADGSYGGQPGGFILSTTEKVVYISGDTALTMDMKLIPLRTKLDLAILPIGNNFTMGVDDAITAAEFLECKTVLGCHYDTFGYIKIDHSEAIKKFEASGKKLHLLGIGESLNV